MTTQTFEFRYHNSDRHISAQSFDHFTHAVRGNSPSNTVFKAIGAGRGRWCVISLSPYIVGPNLVGHLTIERA